MHTKTIIKWNYTKTGVGGVEEIKYTNYSHNYSIILSTSAIEWRVQRWVNKKFKSTEEQQNRAFTQA